MHKTTGEGWNQYRLLILVLSTKLCVLKTTDKEWDQWRLSSKNTEGKTASSRI